MDFSDYLVVGIACENINDKQWGCKRDVIQLCCSVAKDLNRTKSGRTYFPPSPLFIIRLQLEYFFQFGALCSKKDLDWLQTDQRESTEGH